MPQNAQYQEQLTSRTQYVAAPEEVMSYNGYTGKLRSRVVLVSLITAACVVLSAMVQLFFGFLNWHVLQEAGGPRPHPLLCTGSRGPLRPLRGVRGHGEQRVVRLLLLLLQRLLLRGLPDVPLLFRHLHLHDVVQQRRRPAVVREV
jgi:hypothetical protein